LEEDPSFEGAGGKKKRPDERKVEDRTPGGPRGVEKTGAKKKNGCSSTICPKPREGKMTMRKNREKKCFLRRS